jgi:hypothetical protein
MARQQAQHLVWNGSDAGGKNPSFAIFVVQLTIHAIKTEKCGIMLPSKTRPKSQPVTRSE